MAGQDTNKLVIIKERKRREQQPIPSTAGDGCWWCWCPCLLAHRSRRGYHQVGAVKNTQTCPKVVPKLSQSRPKVVILLAVVTTIIKYSWKQSKQNFCCILIHKHRSGAVTTRCKPPSFLAGGKNTLFQVDSVNVFFFSWRNMMA